MSFFFLGGGGWKDKEEAGQRRSGRHESLSARVVCSLGVKLGWPSISITILNYGQWPLWWHAGDLQKRRHTNIPSWMGRRGSGENIEPYLWEEEENICKNVNSTRLPREACATSSSGCEWTSCSFTFRKCMLKASRKLHACVPEASFCWLKLSSGLWCCTCGCGWPGHVFSEDVLGGRFFFFFLIFPPVQPCAIIFVLATLLFFTSWGELYSCGHFTPSIREIKSRNARTKIWFPKDVTLFWWH